MQVSTIGDSSNGSGPSTDPDADALDHDDVYHLLQHERRRHVVRALADGDVDAAADLRSLVERVAAEERSHTAGDLSDEDRQRIYVDLYQSHLPKLARFAVVRYDRDDGEVEPGPALARVSTFLPEELGDTSSEPAETAGSTEPPRPWLAAYGLATLASVGVLALAAVGPGVVSLSTDTAPAAVTGIYATVTAALFLASAA